jgi:hypothetical protein
MLKMMKKMRGPILGGAVAGGKKRRKRPKGMSR